MQETEIADSVQNLIFDQLPLSGFFNAFLKSPPDIQERPLAFFTDMLSSQKQGLNEMQHKLLSTIAERHLCPNFDFVLTDCLGPDTRIACCQRRRDVSDTSTSSMWAALEFTIKARDCDVLEDRKAMREETLFAYQQLTRQHRTFVFTVSIFSTEARFLLWDRSGVAITVRTDYVQNPHWLATFLWRYSSLVRDPDARGFDISATVATAAESRLLIDAVKSYLARAKAGEEALVDHAHETLDKTYPTYKVWFKDDLELLVRRPVYAKGSVVGTATRGYLAYHTKKRRLLFLKDFWDLEPNRVLSIEKEIYDRLRPFKIAHLPKNLAIGPVPDSADDIQQTRSQDVIREKWVRREHNRVLQELYYPITELASSRDVVCIMRDCLQALQEAYQKANVVHSDVSLGNIMMTDQFAGVLNDWGNSFVAGKKQQFRFGTWLYMSCEKARDLENRYLPGIMDDLESMFWCLYRQALQYFMVSNTEFRKHWDMLLEQEMHVVDGRPKGVGGTMKCEFLTSERHAEQFRDGVKIVSRPLKDLIGEFRELLGRQYIARQRIASPGYDRLSGCEKEEDQRNIDALKDARAVIQLFDDALAEDGWVENDSHETKFWADEVRDRIAFVSDLGVPDGARTDEVLDALSLVPRSDLEQPTRAPILQPQDEDTRTAQAGDQAMRTPDDLSPKTIGKHPRSPVSKTQNDVESSVSCLAEEPPSKRAKQN